MPQSVTGTSFKSYLIVFITALQFFYAYALNNIFNTISPFLLKTLSLPMLKLGFIASLFFYGNLLFLIPAGLLLDRGSPKLLIPLSSAVCASSILVIALTHNVMVLSIARFLMGAFASFGFAGGIKVTATLIDEKNIAKVMGLLATLGMLGGLIVQSPLTALIHYTSWRYSLVIVAVAGYLICALIFFALLRVNFIKKSKEEMAKVSIFKLLLRVFKNLQNVLYGLYASFMNLSLIILGALFGVPYLMAVEHFSRTQSAAIASMLFLGSMIGTPFIGLLADLSQAHKKIMIIAACFSSAILYLILFYQHSSVGLVMALFFCLGFGLSGQMLSYPLILRNNPQELSAIGSTVVTFFLLIGGVIIQPLFGFLVEFFSNQGPANSAAIFTTGKCLIITTLLALLVSFFVRKKSNISPLN